MREEKATILVVDDTETNIDILLGLLDDYDVIVATDGQSALDIVKEDDIDLILLDIMMPGMDGYEVCAQIKNGKKDIPIIFITAKLDEDSIEKAYEVGGDDYITKPFKPRELIVRIKTQLKVKHLINHLEYIGTHDEMTGIYNRRKFFELAHDKFENGVGGLYAIMMDIDKFKAVNDSYGHAMGDEVIKLVTKTISQHLLVGAVLGRLGGEEFAIVCNSLSSNVVKQNMEDIREAIENLELMSENNESIKFTISEGISKATLETKNLDDLLQEADEALYEAKGSGRNRVIFRT